jgi:hypothetical protein
MPNERAGGPDNSVDGRHLLLIGAGPGLGMAVARRFAVGGYQSGGPWQAEFRFTGE